LSVGSGWNVGAANPVVDTGTDPGTDMCVVVLCDGTGVRIGTAVKTGVVATRGDVTRLLGTRVGRAVVTSGAALKVSGIVVPIDVEKVGGAINGVLKAGDETNGAAVSVA